VRVFLIGALAAVALGCGPSRGAVGVGGSGTYPAYSEYDGAYGEYATEPSYADVDAFALGLRTPTLSVFYEQLAPYGQWINHPEYGRVFTPADRGYVPYQDGRWVYTDAGWYWQANEPFGWAVSHYGRWDSDPSYGWIWVPDTRWAPAWVDWRSSDDMIGWAPLTPRRTRVYAQPERDWRFVHRDHLTQPDLRRYTRRVDHDYVRTRTEPISTPTTRVPARPIPRYQLQRVRGRVEPPGRDEPRGQGERDEHVTPPPRQIQAPYRRIEPPRRAVPPPHAVPPPRQAEPAREATPPRAPTRRVIPSVPARQPDKGQGKSRKRDRDRDRDHDRDDDRSPPPKKKHHHH
jgi:hypothetical protein